GCSDWLSAVPTICSTSFSLNPSAAIISVNVGSPFVTVPVLSSTTVSMDCVCSKYSPPLNNIPISAARPEPAIIDVGVANPSAHGHAITKIEIVGIKLDRKSPGVTITYQIKKVAMAITTTMGTTTPEILSANRRKIGRAHV